jgi:hypothetical protein
MFENNLADYKGTIYSPIYYLCQYDCCFRRVSKENEYCLSHLTSCRYFDCPERIIYENGCCYNCSSKYKLDCIQIDLENRRKIAEKKRWKRKKRLDSIKPYVSPSYLKLSYLERKQFRIQYYLNKQNEDRDFKNLNGISNNEV